MLKTERYYNVKSGSKKKMLQDFHACISVYFKELFFGQSRQETKTAHLIKNWLLFLSCVTTRAG